MPSRTLAAKPDSLNGSVFGYQGNPSWAMVTLQPPIEQGDRFQPQVVTRAGRYTASAPELTARLGVGGAPRGPVPSTYASHWSRPVPAADVVHGLSRWPSWSPGCRARWVPR